MGIKGCNQGSWDVSWFRWYGAYEDEGGQATFNSARNKGGNSHDRRKQRRRIEKAWADYKRAFVREVEAMSKIGNLLELLDAE